MEYIEVDGAVVPHRIVPVGADGSCFFYSLSYLMFGDVSHATQLRASVVEYICNNWDRFQVYTLMPCGNIYKGLAEYRAHMSLYSTYATPCEIQAAGELYSNHLVVYHDGQVILQPDAYEQGKSILRFKCSGPMMNAHFEPLCPQYTPAVVNQPVSSSLCTEHIDVKGPINYESDDDVPLIYLLNSHKCDLSLTSTTDLKSSASSETLTNVDPCVGNKRRKTRRCRVNNRIKRQKHRTSVRKYAKKHPEVNRESVRKYNKKNPHVNKSSVVRYQIKHTAVIQEAVRRYNEKRALIPWKLKPLSGFKYDRCIDYSCDKVVSLGPYIECKWCRAKKWKEESPGLCCSNNKVHLPPIQQRPEPLHSLITNNHPQSEHFLTNIRKYNSCFQMTSFGAKEVHEGKFMPTFKVQGQVYHRIGSLLPGLQDNPSFLQIYFVGNDERETEIRSNLFNVVKPLLVGQLQKCLHDNNPYIRDFKTTIENVPEGQEFKVVIRADRKPRDEHKGRFNVPTTSEVALVIVGQEFEKRDIILHGRNTKLVRISETHRAYDALQYPLMFCRGEDGYSIDISQRDPKSNVPLNKTVSASDFYAYRIMERQSDESNLFLYRSLFNQYLVDMYAKIETERLNYIRFNQSKLRVENYVLLKDALCQGDANVSNIGQRVVLPSSFTGGQRYMHERTQDAMTYVRHYGRPDLFITFTCNPKWTDIGAALKDGQKPQDRHDIIARVFHLKVKILMNLLTKGSIFGQCRCYMYTVEWQKRGLPHVHILLWLQVRIMADQIDNVISAEVPDPETDPELHDIIKSTMIHRPCGNINRNSPCMVNGSCSKRYPRPLSKETQTADDGYPQYRRRSPVEGGFIVNKNGIELDSRWVVPYNPVLSRTFLAHINVELCTSVKSIKYICKYVNKGSDQAAFALENERDEVSSYEAGRYISSSEAAWRIFCFSIHERSPPVMHLAVHLENGQRVYFNPENVQEKVQNPKKTTLLGFFELCQSDNFARTLIYSEVPAYYTWNKNTFRRRKQGKAVPGYPGVKKDHVLGRVYTVHPNNVECYYLRMLLHHVKGPTCFNDLKSVSGLVHPTFQSACLALGLLEDDNHWDITLEEAVVSESPNKIRQLFAVILVFCQPANPLVLWEKYRDSMSEDIKRQIKHDCPYSKFEPLDTVIYNKCLQSLETLVSLMCQQTLQQLGLPSPSTCSTTTAVNHEYVKELNYNAVHLSEFVVENVPKLNYEQKIVYDEVMASIESEAGIVFFLDAPGGTGKTFLINLILATIRKDKSIAIAVASSGIAATLLDGGKTAHSAFKLPLDLNYSETPLCNISKQSNMAQVLKDCKLIIWDECTMAHKRGIEALDRTLQDIRCNLNLMGGITFLLAGDFRQTLPVVPRGTRADEVKACLKKSNLWPKVQVRALKTNMRVHLKGSSKADEFSSLLLDIGNGNLPDESGKVNIPNELCEVVCDLQALANKIYPDLRNIYSKELSWFKERAILSPKNDSASTINNVLLNQLPTDIIHYQSVDSVVEEEDAVHYPVEFLQTLNPSGIPPHNLYLKVGAPIMLLRNLVPPKLCNGTRLQIKALHKHVIIATIFTGCAQGEEVFIPRIPLIPSDYHFKFKRLQFPVKLCFAMTINKSQGQSLEMAGVDLREDCFSHGQLYVACSRVSSANNLTILQPQCQTKNVVYKEVL